jgi:hypothetical protein
MLKYGWLALLVACGGGGSGASDARDASGTSDAADSGAAIDAPADAIGCGGGSAVTATGPALPAGSTEQLTITAVSHDASGAYCARTTATGANAHLTIDVPPGGMLTLVAQSDVREQHTVTWTGVKPGDDLIFPSLARDADERLIQVQLTIPALPGVTSYDWSIVCEDGVGLDTGTAPAGPLSTSSRCRSGSQHVTAWIKATTADGTQYASGDVTPIASSGSTVIPIGAWTPAASPTTTITGALAFAHASLGVSPGVRLSPFISTALLNAVPQEGTATFPPQPLPAALAGEVDYSVYSTRVAALVIHRPYAASPPSADLAVGNDFLPAISATVDAELPRPQISWTSASALAGIDIALVRRGFWIVVTDGTSSSVRFPELPPDLVPTDNLALFDVDMIESPELDGYDGARRDPLHAYGTHEYRMTSAGWLYSGTF